MIDYVIIDNDAKCRNIYKEIIKKIMFPEKIEYQIIEYSKINNETNDFIKNDNCYKIFLIDINSYNEENTIKFAQNIRNDDSKSEIIFFCSNEIINEKIYENIRKVYCIIDKIDDLKNTLKTELSNIVKSFISINIFFPLDKKGNLQVSLNNILYIYRETTERKLYVVTYHNKYPVNLCLSKALTLCNNYFKQIHRACIVNTQKVILYNWNENYFVLKNYEKVFMCSKKYKDTINTNNV